MQDIVFPFVGGLGLFGYWLTGGIWTPMTVKVTCGK